jgi:hypothetical protein
MQIQFTDNSPLDWSAGEGVQIFSDEITEDVKVVAVLPHPMSSPDCTPWLSVWILLPFALLQKAKGFFAVHGSRIYPALGSR